MAPYKKLSITSPNELIFGTAPFPVTCGQGLVIGGGLVYPEINFTLPTMLINEANWKQVLTHYHAICERVLLREKKMGVPGLVIEFEQLPDMTMNPALGGEITALIRKHLDDFHAETAIPTALRVTVVDLRDADQPPLLRTGSNWEATRHAFVLSAQTGADILSIESVGGKEVHDQALLYADLPGIIASLGILGHADVSWLWQQISSICKEYQIIPGGDTACGFSNTSMQLAGQGMIPSSLAALDRAASAPRSLAAFENGAVGPSKDCAYEGPIIKAIAGVPISMEGRSSCCAHFSPLGNIAGAAADLWSNESVQNINLLSGSAPEAFMELLAYDCRLFNVAHGQDAMNYRNLLVKSDAWLSPEALMLEPETVIGLARAIVKEEGGYQQTLAAVWKAYEAIVEAIHLQHMPLTPPDRAWLEMVPLALEGVPSDEQNAVDYLVSTYGDHFSLDSYGL
jgi:methanol--5-hydroxybenzimidazolylcobamide Co-methyltransferase